MIKKIKLILLTIISSIVIGGVSSFFLKGLELAKNLREVHTWLIFLIVPVGVLTAYIYKNFGKNSSLGNNLIIRSVDRDERVPLRMGVLTFIFTILTHLSGGSAGREGTAVQIGGTITNRLGSLFKLEHEEKRILIMSGISSGFGSVFGTPLTGAFFGMEVCYLGKLSYEGLFSCFLGAFIGDFSAHYFGATHTSYKILTVPEMGVKVILVVVLSSILFGITGKLFSIVVFNLKKLYSLISKNYLTSALISSSVIFILIYFNREYMGLSTWLIKAGFDGEVSFINPIMKFILTTLTLGAGFQGGEVTPLFDIGASLGGSLGNIFSIPPSFLAALGMITVFGSATNTPISTIILGIELFGVEGSIFYIIASLIGYYTIGYSGIYSSQIIEIPKDYTHKDRKNKNISDYSKDFVSKFFK